MSSSSATRQSEPPQTLKLLLIGASSVGKSSLLLRFTSDEFLTSEETSATIGVDYKHKMISRNGKRFKLSIWDTAGQERFRTLTSSYYRGAHGVMIVYDVTNRSTFDSLNTWFHELETFVSSTDVVRMVVGNKIDKEFARTVTTEEGALFAKSSNPPCLFRECSAKGNLNIEEVFNALVDKIIDNPSLWSSNPALLKSPNFPGALDLSKGEDDTTWGSCAC